MNKKMFGSVKNFLGCLKKLNFKTALKPHEMAQGIEITHLKSYYLESNSALFNTG